MSVLALIPARSGSKGIPGKNFRKLGDRTLVEHAHNCAARAGIEHVVLTTDYVVDSGTVVYAETDGVTFSHYLSVISRPDDLAQDDTPMFDVIRHALEQIPGPQDQIVLLIQPTQPLRRPKHLQQAIELLRESGADSVVSVTPLPLTHSPEYALRVQLDGQLKPCTPAFGCDLMGLPKRRQDVDRAYRLDGTCYAFFRHTVNNYRSIYGYRAMPLIIPPEETCELDTEADWASLEARWRHLHG